MTAGDRSSLRRRCLSVATLVAASVLGLSACGDGDEGGDEIEGGAGSAPSSGPTECPPDEKPDEPRLEFGSPPPDCLDPDVDYSAVLHTSLGDITIDLLEEQAPATVNNFVVLARYGYHDGVAFHRVVPGFVVQGGDPTGEPPGTGGPGYSFDDELPEAGAYELGSVAMANAGPDTNGSQFFIVTGDDGTALDPAYSLFGTVTEGFEVAKRIEVEGADPDDPVTVDEVEIVEN